jgi:glycosyltransferase involved in cell wall biosynthesis
MKILHVATLVTPDGAYGGPIRVALNQLAQLVAEGHEVELVAGVRGYLSVPTEIDGIPVSLFPVKQAIPGVGFAGMVAPHLQAYIRRRIHEVDAVHVHLARDFVTMPAALAIARSSTPLTVQPHGMIVEATNRMAPAFDALLTRRVLRMASNVLALTAAEESSLKAVARGPVSITRIANGVPPSGLGDAASGNEVLFLARLQDRKRPTMFVEMAKRLLDDGVEATFALVGPDEGEGVRVQELISSLGIQDSVVWEGALPPDKTLERISRAAIYVLPSVGEVFPMSVLEAMSVGRAVVITSSNGLAASLAAANAARVVDESLDGLVAATRQLIENKADRESLGARAREVAESQYTMPAVAAQLISTYTGQTSSSPTTGESRISMSKSNVVAFVQPFVPSYRKGLFDAIAGRLAQEGLRLEVWHDQPKGIVASRGNAISGTWSVAIRQHRLSVRRRNVTYRSIVRRSRAVRAVVAGLASSNLETYLLAADPSVTLMLWGHGKNFTAGNNSLDARLEKWLSARATHIFTYTERGADHVASTGVPRSKISTVLNSTDTRALKEAKSALSILEIESLRVEHDVVDSQVALFVGAFDEPKRLPFLFEAADIVARSNPRFVLLLAGAGPLDDYVASEAASRPYARVIGRLSLTELGHLSNIVDVLVMPGRVGLVAVDALALGLPLATTIYPFHAPEADYLTPDTAIWTKNSPEAYADGLIEALSDPTVLNNLRASAGLAGERFSVEQSADIFVRGLLKGMGS